MPFEVRVDRVLEWMDQPPEERPEFINLYFHQPDEAGHYVGIYDKEWVSIY